MKVHIIGSGIIGLFSAYFLVKEGHEVHIIDQTDGSDGCSFQNAGLIVPSHFIPLAAPGMVKQGLKWMFDSSSPFYVKARFDYSLMNWAWKFAMSANQKKANKAMPILKDFLCDSQRLYQNISDSGELDLEFEKKGLLLLCKTEHMLEEEIKVAMKAHEFGLKAEVLTKREIHEKEPESLPEVEGGIFYQEDSHCNPKKLVSSLKAYLASTDVTFSYNTKLVSASFLGKKIENIKVENSSGEFQEIQFDQLVLAAGSWSGELAKIFKLNIPMQAGKGYSFTKEQDAGKKIIHPAILCEARVAVTPFQKNRVRFAGTMELSGINNKIESKRVEAIANAGRAYYPENAIAFPAEDEVWMGLRPCSPDGLPFIGRSKSIENLVIATGHAMLGISLAPVTGKLVADQIGHKKDFVTKDLFSPNRFEK